MQTYKDTLYRKVSAKRKETAWQLVDPDVYVADDIAVESPLLMIPQFLA